MFLREISRLFSAMTQLRSRQWSESTECRVGRTPLIRHGLVRAITLRMKNGLVDVGRSFDLAIRWRHLCWESLI